MASRLLRHCKRLEPWRWHFYDNKGSYNGYFDWLPLYLRVGPWSPFAVIFIVAWAAGMYLYAPSQHLKVAVPDSLSGWWWWNLFVTLWGIYVIIHCKLHHGVAPILVSYTMWSWISLTLHTFCATIGALYPSTQTGKAILLVGEFVRFPSAVGATVTWWLWNFLLFPLIYVFACKNKQAKDKFWKFNFGFFMTCVHILNLPLVAITLCIGGDHGGVRYLDPTDLWCGLLVALLYALVYLLVLDRAGVHLYPIFSPRTHFCVLSYSVLLCLYIGCWHVWNLSVNYLI